MKKAERTHDANNMHIFRRSFAIFRGKGAPWAPKKCPRGVPRATRRLSGGLFWGRMADLKRMLLANTPTNMSPWRLRAAPRCPKALQDAILERKFLKHVAPRSKNRAQSGEGMLRRFEENVTNKASKMKKRQDDTRRDEAKRDETGREQTRKKNKEKTGRAGQDKKDKTRQNKDSQANKTRGDAR